MLFDKNTEEQNKAIKLFNSEQILKINAFAGTGKTKTLLEIAKNNPNMIGLYIAFNKNIVQDIKSKKGGRGYQNLETKTVHALAFKYINQKYKYNIDKLIKNGMQPNLIANELNLKDTSFKKLTLDSYRLGQIIQITMEIFCYSDKDNINYKMIIRAIRKLSIIFFSLKQQELEHLVKMIKQLCEKLWVRMQDENNSFPLGHNGYLKLWALEKPILNYDYILLDEAQDTSDVVISVLTQQKCKIVYVGDKYQQIYEWRGAINAMAKIRSGKETFLTKSFRFGENIARLANQVLKKLGEERVITVDKSIDDSVGLYDLSDKWLDKINVMLSYRNSTVIENVIRCLIANKKVYLLGDVNELRQMLNDVILLKQRKSPKNEFFYGFEDWIAVIEFSQTESGSKYTSFVEMVETYGEKYLLQKLNKIEQKEDSADIVVSTVHKVKGREWDSVYLSNDLVPSNLQQDLKIKKEIKVETDINSYSFNLIESDGKEELRILYVAITRAKRNLVYPKMFESLLSLQ